MSNETAAALASLVTAILGGLAAILVRLFKAGRLGDVIAARADQERTAVQTMAAVLDKAVDGMVTMAGAVQQMGSEMAGLRQDSQLVWQSERDMLKNILDVVTEFNERQKTLVNVLANNGDEAGGRDR